MSKKSDQIGIRVTPEMKDLLLKISEYEDRSISQQCERFIKIALKQYLENNPQIAEHLKDKIDTLNLELF